ncbi:Transcriptional regulatory protein ZraR [Pirellulimonas nuda]|uniref:Transcriptional regulatory protein ZraR n=1 Tax=Pirellulimonas nuda TaxID=2528009 RepID=A0A518DBF8_9BACT|nr:sigma-54 dependent transcriptional regulator [Pirellulimonas nuda]QDU88817.1 Transcriptional regulatory protein ZraR [Pirellulimonas nuda]
MTDSPTARILIADDEPLYLRTTGELLRKAGYSCECVGDARAAVEALSRETFDLVLSDLNMPGNAELELLRQGRARWPNTPLIVVTGVPSLPTAIESVRLGIADYLLKPVRFDDLLSSVRRALARRPLAPPAAERDEIERRALAARFPEIIGDSPPMLELFDVIDRVAKTDANILITGESGTGKEVTARAIHRHSPRAQHNFQVIDCTAVPETLFESVLFGHVKGSFTGAVKDQEGLLRRCHLGTAFFDEIGELPGPLQAKLLRVIQEQTFTPVGKSEPVQVDTRFLCATNRDLELEMNAGRFRRDLFYRLSVIHLELPPLRQRGGDVVLLAQKFLTDLRPNDSHVEGFSDEVLDCFKRYAWPGNIRELRNVVERAVALERSDQIGTSSLPPALLASAPDRSVRREGAAGASREQALEEAEHAFLISLLQQHQGNVSHAAEQAGMSRQGMHKLLKKHAISAARFRD